MRQLRARTPPHPLSTPRWRARGRFKGKPARVPTITPLGTYRPDGPWCAHLVPGGVRLEVADGE